MRKSFLIALLLTTVASCGFFSDILSSIFKSGKPSFSGLVKGLPKELLDSLKDDEQAAARFVCDILYGDVPVAIKELGSAVWDEIESDFTAVANFITSLPTLVPEAVEDVIEAGEDVVGGLEELFTHPEQALEDVEEFFLGAFVCGLMEDCLPPSTTSSPTSVDPAASWSSSCQNSMAAATTTISMSAGMSTTMMPTSTST